MEAPTRLSRKADQTASSLIFDLDERVRRTASAIARANGKEFADETHVKEAYRLLILKIAEKFQART